jgi:hypothetical protein
LTRASYRAGFIRSGVAIGLGLFATAAWALPAGCALFMDLNSDPYRQAEAGAGEGGTCTGDAGCTILAIDCSTECPSGQACCVTINSSTSYRAACEAPAACSAAGALSVELCAATGECEDGDSCIAQTCPFTGPAIVRACSLIPMCTAQ